MVWKWELSEKGDALGKKWEKSKNISYQISCNIHNYHGVLILLIFKLESQS